MKFLSSPWSAVSGSIGGTTYGRGPFGGLVARSRGTPSNPNTSAQQAARTAMGTASTGWAVLTAANQLEWEDYAALTPLTNAIGESITVGGLQMYQRWAALRHLIGEAITHPSPMAISGLGNPPTGVALDADLATYTVTVSAGASDDGDVFGQLSMPLGAGQNSIHYPLSLAGDQAIAAAATTAAITPAQTLVTAEKRVCRVRLITDDGRVSQTFTEQAVATGT